jgi:hypothetical protein
MTTHTINGIPISAKAHSALKHDCVFYATQCENDDSVDVIVPLGSSFSSSVLENVFKLAEDDDCFPFKKTKSAFVLEIELREFYDMLEILHLLMSKNLKAHAISWLSSLVACHPYVFGEIQNKLEFFEKAYLAQPPKNHGATILKEGIHACEYRFTEDLWIDMKIIIFDLTITRSLGCGYIQVNTMKTLFRLEPQTELEIRVRDLKSYKLVIERIEYDAECWEKRMNLLNCRVYYTNGSMYHGGLRFDKDLGFQRHGVGKFYSTCHTDSEERHCRYLYDKAIDDCFNHEDMDCDCSFCTCDSYRIGCEDLDDDEKIDQRRCFFNYEKSNCFQHLNGKEDDSLLSCKDCNEICLEHINSLYVSRNKVLGILCRFELPKLWRVGYDEQMNDVLTKTLAGMDHFWTDSSVKSIATYEDYMNYILVNPKRVSECNAIFHQKVQNVQKVIERIGFLNLK